MNIIKTFGVLSALIASTATVSAQTLMEPLRKDFTLSKREGKDQNAIFRCLTGGIIGQEFPPDSMSSEKAIAFMNHKLDSCDAKSYGYGHYRDFTNEN